MCGCGVSRRYIDVCYCDMFSVVNVYLDHLKFCVNGRRYVCCGECYVVSVECDEPFTTVIRSGRLRWYGHVMRKNYEDWVKKCMEFRVEGRRPVGRPRRTWLKSGVEVDMA